MKNESEVEENKGQRRRKESGERVGKNREWGGENVREVKFIQGESGKSGGKKFKFFMGMCGA